MAIESRNRVSAGFSMSSMTDIVFLLLIFFIIVSTLVTTNSVNLLLPKKTTTNVPVPKPPNVKVSVTSDSQVFVDGSQVGPELLESTLVAAMTSDMNGIVLKTDPEASTESVVQIMDIAQRNEFKIALTMDSQ